MEPNNTNQDVTGEEKLRAIESLRVEVKNYINLNEKQNAVNSEFMKKLRRVLYLIKVITLGTGIITFISICMAGYLILKPREATKVTLDYVTDQMNNLSTQKKLNQFDREDISKKETALIIRERKDSADRADIAIARKELAAMVSEMKKTKK